MLLRSTVSNRKKKSLMSLYGGSSYLISSVAANNNFFNKMLNYDKDEKEFENIDISLHSDKLKLVINNTGRKDSNLFFHIEKLIDRKDFNENFFVERLELFAGTKQTNYFDLLDI